jgi:tripartite-type tricarboxylate transporter receptor subunit TctC
MTAKAIVAAMLASGCLSTPAWVAAQAYPTKPVRLVIPYAAGGGTDLTARPIAVKLTERFGRQVLLDNRPGGAGMIGADLVAKSAPDGYTVLVSAASEMSMNVTLFRKMPYDPIADFQAVTLATTTPAILVAHPSLPVKSVKEVIALAKARPKTLSYASVGIGSPMHFAGELMNSMVGVDMAHVPYKGAAPALADLLGGHIPLGFVTLLAASPHVTSGKLRALGVTSGKRATGMPNVPTIAEAGLPGFDIVQWFAVWVPAQTPKDIVDKLNTEITAIVRSPEYKQRMLEAGTEAVGGPAEELRAFQKNEIAKYRKIAATAGIQPE